MSVEGVHYTFLPSSLIPKKAASSAKSHHEGINLALERRCFIVSFWIGLSEFGLVWTASELEEGLVNFHGNAGMHVGRGMPLQERGTEDRVELPILRKDEA